MKQALEQSDPEFQAFVESTPPEVRRYLTRLAEVSDSWEVLETIFIAGMGTGVKKAAKLLTEK